MNYPKVFAVTQVVAVLAFCGVVAYLFYSCDRGIQRAVTLYNVSQQAQQDSLCHSLFKLSATRTDSLNIVLQKGCRF